MRRRKREREYNLIQTDANSNNGRVKIRYISLTTDPGGPGGPTGPTLPGAP